VDLEELRRLLAAAWPAPWVARTFEIECPCPNGEDCGDLHACDEVEAPEAYPASPDDPAPPGQGQCVVQIAVPGLESLAGPNAEFIAAARNSLPSLLDRLEAAEREADLARRERDDQGEEITRFVEHKQDLERRLSALTTTLAALTAEFSDALPYVPEYFRQKWAYDEALAAARAVLGQETR
jgi:hypothetical protein